MDVRSERKSAVEKLPNEILILIFEHLHAVAFSIDPAIYVNKTWAAAGSAVRWRRAHFKALLALDPVKRPLRLETMRETRVECRDFALMAGAMTLDQLHTMRLSGPNGPGIEKLVLPALRRLECSRMVLEDDVMRHISETSPLLQSLSVCVWNSAPKLDRFSRFLQSCKHLRAIEVAYDRPEHRQDPLNTDLVATVMRDTRFEEVSFSASVGFYSGTSTREVLAERFANCFFKMHDTAPRLRKLTIPANQSALVSLVHASQYLPNLDSFDLTLTNDGLGDDLLRVVRAYPSAVALKVYTPRRFRFRLETLCSLPEMRSMQRLELREFDAFRFDEASLDVGGLGHFLETFPNLTRLCLSISAVGSWDAIEVTARCCQELREIELALPRDLSDWVHSPPLFPRLRALALYYNNRPAVQQWGISPEAQRDARAFVQSIRSRAPGLKYLDLGTSESDLVALALWTLEGGEIASARRKLLTARGFIGEYGLLRPTPVA